MKRLQNLVGTPPHRFLVLGLLVLVVVSAGCFGGGGGQGNASGATATASLVFETQTTGGQTVVVQSVTLPRGGYVAIYIAGEGQNSVVGTIIGVSDYLKPGTHENVRVTLYKVPGVVFSQEQLRKSQTLSAVPHQDTNGNRMFDFFTSQRTRDEPYTKNGSAIVDTAYVFVEPRPNATATTTQSTTAT